MFKKIMLASTLTLSFHLGSPLNAFADQVFVLEKSPISNVVAYQGQGIVTRKALVEIKNGGNYQLKITDMPLNVMADSLHVKGQGQANVTINNVQLMPLPPGTVSPAVKKAQSRVKELQTQIERIENELGVIERSQEWLNQYWEREEGKGNYKPENWQQTLDFLAKNQAQLLEKETACNLRKELAQNSLNEAQKELQSLQTNENQKTQAAVIYFSAKNAGHMNFELSYLIPGIQWTPSYDARLDEKSGKVSLTYFGDLLQQSGENWQDINLSLSTSAPQVNSQVPILEPWVITNNVPVMDGRLNNLPAGAPKESMSRAELFDDEEVLDETESENANFAESEIQTQGLSVLFAIPQQVSIESAPNPRRVAIATRSFAYAPEYHVVPKLSSQVYLKARFRNNGDLPFLAGQIRNYVDLDYTGTSQIPLVRPNEEASLNFGVEPNIRVTRREGEEKKSLEGLMRDIEKRVMSYEIEVSNFKNKAAQVIVWDHLPLVDGEKIKLNVIKIQPEATEKSRSNLLKWVLDLKPQEKRKITVSYSVEHPVELEVYSNFRNEMQPAKRKQINQQQYEKF